jgi:hypothetical protein
MKGDAKLDVPQGMLDLFPSLYRLEQTKRD